jgi:phosphate acetyltransferase
MRKAKGLTLEEAKKLIQQPIYFAMMLVKNGLADGVVAGAKYSTADVLRPALQIIKTKPDKKIVTGGMLMLKDNENPLFFGDVSLVENPTSEQLAEIALGNAEFMQKVLNVEPKVAMLSYSTKGSAKHEMVDKVRVATELAKNRGFMVDGEMQVDSALDLATAQKKGVNSEVGGNANVLVFPDLNAGNIGYKLVARLGGYDAIGPIMLNFNKPVNDLSRGCTVDEIVNTVVITKLLV